MDTDKPVRHGFRLGCYGWIWLGLVVATIVCISGWVWLGSHGDLVALTAELQAKGRKATWADLAFRTTTLDRVADWRRLLQLGAAVKLYEVNSYTWRPYPGEPVPPEAIAFLNAQPASDAAEIRAILGRLGPDPIYTRTTVGFTDSMPEIEAQRTLLRWFLQRIVLRTPDEVVDELALAAQLITGREPPTLIGTLVSASHVSTWLCTGTARLSDLPTPDRHRLAGVCRDLEALLDRQSTNSLQTEVVTMIHFGMTMRVSDVYQSLKTNGSFWGGSGSTVTSIAQLLSLRMVRTDMIRNLSDFAESIAASSTPAARLAGIRTLTSSTAGLTSWSPRRIGWDAVMPSIEMVIVGETVVRDQLLLLAAELDGTAWPVDSLDPASKPWRRLERDGKLVGAYSVGKNGIDDHGTGDDRCLDLYGRCRLPKP